MTSRQENNRIKAIMAMRDNSITTLWDHVVIRGTGCNWKLGGTRGAWLGVMETIRGLR